MPGASARLLSRRGPAMLEVTNSTLVGPSTANPETRPASDSSVRRVRHAISDPVSDADRWPLILLNSLATRAWSLVRSHPEPAVRHRHDARRGRAASAPPGSARPPRAAAARARDGTNRSRSRARSRARHRALRWLQRAPAAAPRSRRRRPARRQRQESTRATSRAAAARRSAPGLRRPAGRRSARRHSTRRGSRRRRCRRHPFACCPSADGCPAPAASRTNSPHARPLMRMRPRIWKKVRTSKFEIRS